MTTVHVDTREVAFEGLDPRRWRVDVPGLPGGTSANEMHVTLAYVVSVYGFWTWNGDTSVLVAPRVTMTMGQGFGPVTDNKFTASALNTSSGMVRSEGYNRYLPGSQLARTMTFSGSTGWIAKTSANIIKRPSLVGGFIECFPSLSFRATRAINPAWYTTQLESVTGTVTLDVEYRKV